MRALVLCAGFGRRLGGLCQDSPKPLLEVGGLPIVEHILRRLGQHGVQEAFVNLHYRAEQFPPRLGDGRRFGFPIRYLHEEAPLGTGGTARDLLAQVGVGGDLLVHYGDILTDHDLGALLRQHRAGSAWATLLLHRRPHSNSHAVLEPDGRVSRFVERPAVPPSFEEARPPWVFSGVCVLSPACAAALPARPELDLPRDVFPSLAEEGRLQGQPLAGHRVAVDSPERLQAARDAWAGGQFRPWESSHKEEPWPPPHS